LSSSGKTAPPPKNTPTSRAPQRWAVITLIGCVAMVFAVLLFTGLSRLLSRPAPGTATPDPVAATPPPEAPPAVAKIKATLYFASEDGLRLVPTEREVPLSEGVVAQARSILEAQLAAEAPTPLATTIPKGAVLRGIFVSERNEVFVDLDPAIRTAHPGGVFLEVMTVYTIVNAVLTNLPNLQEVQILIGGQEVDTLAGHVDLRRPLRKNETLIQQ
jgi:hypothetical protein